MKFKEAYFIIGYFFICSNLLAQNQRMADSLLLIFENSNLTIEQEFELLRSIAEETTNPNDALAYSKRLIKYALENKSNIWLAHGYIQKGNALRFQGKLEESIAAYFESAEISKKIDFKEGIASALLSIGTIYANNGDHKKGIKYRIEAISMLRQTSDSITLAAALMNTGYGYYLINNFDSALLYYNESEKIYTNKDYTLGKAYNLGNAGLVYAKQGKTLQAEENLTKAIEILTVLEDSYAITEFQIEMASIFQLKGDFATAEKYLQEALAYSQKDGLQERIRDASLKLSELYESNKDYQKAYFYHRQHLAFRDSINNEDVIRKMADLRTAFEVGQKQIEVDLLNQQAKTQWIFLWGMLVVLILVFVIAFVLFKLYKLRNRAIKIAKIRRQVITAQRNELEELNNTKDKFFSIISHDIRSPVSNYQGVSQLIRLYVESGDMEEVIRVTDLMDKSSAELSALLDNLLDWAMSQQGKFPYKPELFDLSDVCKNNLSMMQNLANAKQINLKGELVGGIKITADRNSVSTIIRNLLSNAIKFTSKGGQVTLTALVIESNVEIEITDTGVGISKDKMSFLFGFKGERSSWGTAGEKGVGLGLNLVNEFVQLNHGEIDVDSKEGVGTTFIVTFPLNLPLV